MRQFEMHLVFGILLFYAGPSMHKKENAFLEPGTIATIERPLRHSIPIAIAYRDTLVHSFNIQQYAFVNHYVCAKHLLQKVKHVAQTERNEF
jgi:hypothetical protein